MLKRFRKAFLGKGSGGDHSLGSKGWFPPVIHSNARWILPLVVLGSSSRKTTMRGYL